MGPRRPSTPLGLVMLLVVVAPCFTYLSGVAAEGVAANCMSYIDCTSCLNSTVSCKWLECSEEKQSVCTNQTENRANCTIYTNHTQCLVTPTSDTNSTSHSTIAPGTTTHATTHATSPKETTTSANTTITTSSVPGTESPRKSTFDASSFIGGIVLVLGLQAVIFFLYKFCKSKDQNYHTL